MPTTATRTAASAADHFEVCPNSAAPRRRRGTVTRESACFKPSPPPGCGIEGCTQELRAPRYLARVCVIVQDPGGDFRPRSSEGSPQRLRSRSSVNGRVRHRCWSRSGRRLDHHATTQSCSRTGPFPSPPSISESPGGAAGSGDRRTHRGVRPVEVLDVHLDGKGSDAVLARRGSSSSSLPG
jgi:hypothetical protein